MLQSIVRVYSARIVSMTCAQSGHLQQSQIVANKKYSVSTLSAAYLDFRIYRRSISRALYVKVKPPGEATIPGDTRKRDDYEMHNMGVGRARDRTQEIRPECK
jgi:hypothetical protein